DDDAGLVVPSSVVIQEGDTESFGVRLAQIPSGTVTVTITGHLGTDLTLRSSNVLTFSTSDWDQDQMVELFAQEDPDADEEDPVSLILSASGGGYSLSESVTVTIVEKDPKGIIADPSSIIITEGASERFRVSLMSQPSGEVLVGISGHESTNATVSPSSLLFNSTVWQIPQVVTLHSMNDADLTDEVMTLTLVASGGSYDGQQAEVLVTIQDEGLPKITIFNSEANEQDGVISLPLELSHTSEKVVTVQYSSKEQTADEGVDYTASRGIVIFDPGGTRGVVQLAILDDDQPEDAETFIVTLSNASNATIARPSATAKILDNDGGVPTIMIEDATASQDAHAVMFDLYLSHPSPGPVFLHYRTADGSAIGGEDYAQQSGQVTFPAGSVHATIEVPLLRKEFHGQEETFFVELESTTSAKMDKAIATATLSKQPTESDIAISAYTARFARTVSVQLTEALQERLQPTGSTCSAAQHVESTRLWDPASSWTPSLGELLSGCRVSTTASSGHIGVWGRGAFRRFHGGTDRDVTLRGDVSTAMIGTDYRWSTGWLAGVMVAHSQGSGTIQDRKDDGTIDADLTGIYPYMSYAASDWKVWMSAGYGWGDAEVSNLQEDLTSRFGAVGLKGHLASVRTSRLSYFGDVLLTDVEMKSHGDRGEVVRVRLGVESTFQLSRGWTPYVEANMRQDGGDAETGIGLELGGGLRVHHPGWKLRGEIRSQGLVIHSADGFTEWGLSGSIQVGRSHDGWMIRVRPSYGNNHVTSLHQPWTLMESTPSVPGMYRTEMELGYGMPLIRGTARSFVG
ncbi:MAG: autotransporter domain-containing protein, partial [Bacteroidetes bacterium]|nr:autotransporter domain-containing protein [Bacteroidota bacterium]